MSVAEMSLEEVRRRGLEALARELGPAGLIRFLQQFESGSGDYTAERASWLPDDIQTIVDEIAAQKLDAATDPVS